MHWLQVCVNAKTFSSIASLQLAGIKRQPNDFTFLLIAYFKLAVMLLKNTASSFWLLKIIQRILMI